MNTWNSFRRFSCGLFRPKSGNGLFCPASLVLALCAVGALGQLGPLLTLRYMASGTNWRPAAFAVGANGSVFIAAFTFDIGIAERLAQLP